MICDDRHEVLLPTDCSEIVVKVGDGEKCQKFETDNNGFPVHTCDAVWSCPQKVRNDLGNRPNCFVRVNSGDQQVFSKPFNLTCCTNKNCYM